MNWHGVASPAFVALAVFGCSTDHDLLAQKPDDRRGLDGGVDGSGWPEGDPSVRDAFTASDGRDPEPPGPWTLTWMNGVVDQDAVRFCFVRLADGGEEALDMAPLPAAPGLPFGGKMILSEVPGVDFATMDVHPYLVVGAGGAAADLTCRAIFASREGDATGPTVISLPLLPAGTLADSRSYLAVATGCAHEWPEIDAGAADASRADASNDGSDPVLDAGPDRSLVCGPAASARAGLVLVRLSRTNFSYKLGFQVVHASAATPPASLALDNGATNVTLFFVDEVSFSQIAPRNQPGLVARSDFGSSLGPARVRIQAANAAPFAAVETNLATVLRQSDVQESALGEGHNYSFVALGARPGQTVGAPFHAFRTVLVDNAPRTGPEP